MMFSPGRAIAGYTIDPSPDRRLGREDGLLARDELEGGGALSNVKLGLIHVRLNRRKERSREVTLTSVRQHRKDHRTLRRLLGGLKGSPHGTTPRDASKKSLISRQSL